MLLHRKLCGRAHLAIMLTIAFACLVFVVSSTNVFCLAFEGRLLDVVDDLRTGAVHYTFRVRHIHKDSNVADMLGVSVESSKGDNDTVDVYSPTHHCCSELHVGVHYLLIGQAGVNRLHLRINDVVFDMNELSSGEITRASAQCENVVLVPQENSFQLGLIEKSLGLADNDINSP